MHSYSTPKHWNKGRNLQEESKTRGDITLSRGRQAATKGKMTEGEKKKCAEKVKERTKANEAEEVNDGDAT